MAVQMFLKLDGIMGESNDDKHLKAIDIVAYSWGVRPLSSSSVAAGGTSTPPDVHEVSLVKVVDNASAPLQDCLFSGKHIPNAFLFVRPAGQTLEYQFRLMDVMITRLDFGPPQPESETPTESVTLDFTKFHATYPDGDRTINQMGWNTSSNRKR